MKSKLISKILGCGITAGLVFGLIGAMFAGPAAAGEVEWSKVNTPTWEDGVILPYSDILDYDISGDDGSIVYVVAKIASCSDFLSDEAATRINTSSAAGCGTGTRTASSGSPARSRM